MKNPSRKKAAGAQATSKTAPQRRMPDAPAAAVASVPPPPAARLCSAIDRPEALLCQTAQARSGHFSFHSGDAPDALLTAAPSPPDVIEALRILLDVLFPGKFSSLPVSPDTLRIFLLRRLSKAYAILLPQVRLALPYRWTAQSACTEHRPRPLVFDPDAAATDILQRFLGRLADIAGLVTTDVQAAYEGDPAALSYAEVVLAYPGLLAIAAHRLAHELYRLAVPIIPRIMSEWIHTRTGVDIHPGARIGPAFFIDHATGVVIGETAEIGAHVKLYQGVTLGALSFELDPDGNPVKHVKRHPTLGDNVVVYANATILGGEVVIGKDSVVGSNVFLTTSVPPRTVVSNKHPTLAHRSRKPGA